MLGNSIKEIYKIYKILKVSDYINLLNSLFIRDILLNSSIPPFQNFFTKSENLHQHNTRHAQENSVILSQQNSVFYGIKSIQHQAATTWNQFQNDLNLDLLQNLRLFQKLRSILLRKFLT